MMIDTFSISNFRAFPHAPYGEYGSRFTFDPLLNVVTGRHGSGKTALIDALHVYLSGGNPSVVVDILLRTKTTHRKWLEKPDHFDDLRTIFNTPDYLCSLIGPFCEVELSFGVERESRPELTTWVKGRSPVSVHFESLWSYRVIDPLFPYRRIGVSEDHRVLWSEIALSDDYDALIDAMRLLRPSVERIALIGREGVPFVSDGGRKISLASLGSAVERWLTILLDAVTLRDGVLLIDDIDHGFSPRVFPLLWERLASLTKERGTQVIATASSTPFVSDQAKVIVIPQSTP
jgi:hypothetical protein